MRDWLVAGGIVEGPDGLLLVQNRRRDGSLDWSPPGGVIEVHEGESIVDGLTREVEEETGIVVTEWAGPVYEVAAVAEGLGWSLRVEVHQAVSFTGDIVVDDPDGIVVDARFVPVDECGGHLEGCHPWVREPLGAWLTERWLDLRAYRYRLDGDRLGGITVTREPS
ncbi:MAG: 8-oxo-dGTP diphosphatase [Acidimicrobiaceae bacterium]|nr:8-oxo-dGTP diphosphatase [Acidimicrobiaceae bacterium]